MKSINAMTLSLCLIALLGVAPVEAQFSANDTVTLYVHGFDPRGVDTVGVVGEDESDPVMDSLAALAGLPTAASEPLAPNQVAMTHYYGDAYPSYYTAGDIAEVSAVTAQWNGGIPRYALIVAKYAEEVLRRSGARQVNLIGASMGGLVTRYLIEKDLEGLASGGRIGRWLTINGVVGGNWVVSSSAGDLLKDYFDDLGLPEADLTHMSYDWIRDNLNDPRTRADNPLFSRILVGHWTSTSDDENQRALSLLSGEPNDGVQLHEDTYFHSITERSLFQDQAPVHGWSDATHYTIRDHQGAHYGILAFLSGTRRARIRITEVEIDDIHENFLGGDEGEIVFESEVYSPRAATGYQILDPINEMTHPGGNAPKKDLEEDETYSGLDLFVFDNLIPPGETEFRIYLGARELDRDVFYGVSEVSDEDYSQMGETEVMVSLEREGTYPFETDDWRGIIQVELFKYFTPQDCDLNADGRVDYADLFLLSGQWLEGGTADFDASGSVDAEDLLDLYGNTPWPR